MAHNYTKKQWAEFHYGHKRSIERPYKFMLLDYGDIVVRGSYALCVHVMKQRGDLPRTNMKIVPCYE